MDDEAEQVDPESQTSGANRIAVVGATNVGKTTFFAVLDRALRDQGFSIHATEPDDVRGKGRRIATRQSSRGAQFLHDIRDRVSHGYFPPATQVRSNPSDFQFAVTGPRDAEFSLDFIDPPGEVFEHQPTFDADGGREGHASPGDDEREERAKNLGELRRAMQTQCEKASAMLVLIDIQRSSEEILSSWRYALENFISLALNRSSSGRRIAVVFTKADLLHWQGRYRKRVATEWIRHHPELSDIYRDAAAIRPLGGGPAPEVGFFFSSAVGWYEGSPNCRTVVIARDLDNVRVETSQDWEDLIPDPAVLERLEANQSTAKVKRRGPRGGLLSWSLPCFRDPLRIVEEHVDHEVLGARPVGVLMLPGRRAPRQARGKFLTPWNVIEPLLWAGSYPDLAPAFRKASIQR